MRKPCTLPAAAVDMHMNVLVVTSTCITVFLNTFVKKYNQYSRALERMSVLISAVKNFITNCVNSTFGLKPKTREEM